MLALLGSKLGFFSKKSLGGSKAKFAATVTVVRPGRPNGMRLNVPLPCHNSVIAGSSSALTRITKNL